MNHIQETIIPTPVPNLQNQVEITFSDGAKHLISSAILKKVPFFKTCLSGKFLEVDKINLPEVTKDDLDLIFGLFHDVRQLTEILDENQLTNPETYAHLESLINFFFADYAAGALETIKDQLSCVTYPLALSLLTNHRKSKTSNENLRPFYISTIETLLINSIYFESKEEYEMERLSLIRDAQKYVASKILEQSVLKSTIKSYEATQNSANHCSNQVIYSPLTENEGSKIIIEILKLDLRSKESDIAMSINLIFMNGFKKINMNNARPSKILHLSHLQPNNENEETEKYLAKRCWKIYKANVLCCLQYQWGIGFMMHQAELIAPKLFSYYDLVPKFNEYHNYEYRNFFRCYSNAKIAFYYTSKESYPNLLALEAQMRKDFTEFKVDIPQNLFANDNLPEQKSLLERSLEIQNLRIKVPGLIYPENRKKFIEYWKWDEFEINDFYYEALPNSVQDEDAICFRGKITKFKEDLNFYIKMNDFQPIILDHCIDPTPEATRAYLKELYIAQKNNRASKFNFFSNEKRH